MLGYANPTYTLAAQAAQAEKEQKAAWNGIDRRKSKL